MKQLLLPGLSQDMIMVGLKLNFFFLHFHTLFVKGIIEGMKSLFVSCRFFKDIFTKFFSDFREKL